MTDRNPWTTLSALTRFEDRWIALDDRRVRDAAGQEGAYAVVRFKQVGLRIVPIDDEGCTTLVGQYRYGASYHSWELPAGGGEGGEDARAGAARELAEELGLQARRWLDLHELVLSGAITDQRERAFVAWELSGTARHPDPQEVIRTRRLPFAEAVGEALAGRIRDAGSVAAILAVACRQARGELPADLADRLAGRTGL